MGGSFEIRNPLLLFAVLLSTSSANALTCHCLNGTECHSNGYCEHGCERGWFGPGCQLGNVALNKETNQSSTFYDAGYNYRHNSSLAVDGLLTRRTSGNIAEYCSHTDFQNSTLSAWWLVVLDSALSYIITNVTIINRHDSSASRLTNFVILYSNEAEGNPDRNSNTWHVYATETGTFSDSKTYSSIGTVIAKRVAVYLTAQNATNPFGFLTLCEVQIYGYQQYDCPNGFTGPGCLLRSCDACPSTVGRCTGEYGNCLYDVCPDRSLLAPECWITLSNYTGVNIGAKATCNSLLLSVEQPDTIPNAAASLLQVQVHRSAGRQMVVNTALSVHGTTATLFKFNDATTDTSYEISILPVYCNITNYPCFYGTWSKVITLRTGKRKYVFSHNNSCIVVNMTSAIPDCEVPTAVQVSCEFKDVGSTTINSSSLTTCGLQSGIEYQCAFLAIINANTVEKEDIYILTETVYALREPEKSMGSVSISIGVSVAVLVVTAVGTIFAVYFRRKRSSNLAGTTRNKKETLAQETKTDAQTSAVDLQETKQTNIYEQRNDNSYEALYLDLATDATGDYAAFKPAS